MVSFMRERKAHVTRTSEHWEVKVLLNLDGGGSSTMVVQDPASKVWRVVNQPVGRDREGVRP